MKHPFDEHVAIFWDYENCAPPCSVPGYDVVNNIRQVAHEYGSVKLFKAYLELSEQSSSKSIGLRSELQSCGVSLTDCPHNGRKDVADKMMIVDMLTYAIDNPAPATIVLISGDRDFVYAVSVLRLRKYRVVLLAPNSAHASLKSQASVVLDWETDIMRKTTVRPQTLEACHGASDDALQQRSPRRPMLPFGGPLQQPAPRHARRLSFKVTTPITPVTPISVSDGSRHLRNPSIVTTDESLLPTLLHQATEGRDFTDALSSLRLRGRCDDVGTATPHIPIQDIVECIRGLKEKGEQILAPASRPCADGYSLEDRSAASKILSSVDGPIPSSSMSEDGLQTEVVHPEIKYDVMVQGQSNNIPNVTGPSTLYPMPVNAESVSFPCLEYEPPIMRPATVGPLSRIPKDSTPTSLSTSLSSDEEGFSSPDSRIEPGGNPQHRLPNTNGNVARTPASSVDSLPPVEGVASAPPPLTSATQPPPNDSQPQPTNAATQPDVPALNKADSTPLKRTLATVPACFHHLMRVLERSRLHGLEKPLRSWVALQLPKGTYGQAKVNSFKRYSSAAEKVGIIVLGGARSGAWISLNADWHGKVPVSAAS